MALHTAAVVRYDVTMGKPALKLSFLLCNHIKLRVTREVVSRRVLSISLAVLVNLCATASLNTVPTETEAEL